MKYEITHDGVTRVVDVEPIGDVHKGRGRYRLRFDGEEHEVDVLRPSPEALTMLIDHHSWEAGAVRTSDGWMVDVVGVAHDVAVVDPRRKALRMSAGAAGGTLTTQMPGRIVRVLVAVGDAVKKGQPVMVVEAMKMENELKSPVDGHVAEILVAEGQTVEAGNKLVRIEA